MVALSSKPIADKFWSKYYHSIGFIFGHHEQHILLWRCMLDGIPWREGQGKISLNKIVWLICLLNLWDSAFKAVLKTNKVITSDWVNNVITVSGI